MLPPPSHEHQPNHACPTALARQHGWRTPKKNRFGVQKLRSRAARYPAVGGLQAAMLAHAKTPSPKKLPISHARPRLPIRSL